MIQAIKGFRDVLPGDIELWQEIESEAVKVFENFGFKEIRVPVLEKTALFSRSIGESTDIVEKEMYTFEDRGGDMLTMRPEATASVVRSYIQHNMQADNPIRKLYTIGPMFRRERPQKGRYRQFYQINAEVFGIASPYIDAQLMVMLSHLLDRLGVTELSAHINSLGCPCCRPSFQNAIKEMAEKSAENLCDDCKRRKDKNPLRILDCKSTHCQEILKDAPVLADFLCDECRNHFDIVKSSLESQNVKYTIDHKLVRGLDYYTRTAFELKTNMLGAQNSVAGGGRYDGLVKGLGGPDVPAIGFAIGFDRLVEVIAASRKPYVRTPEVFIMAPGNVPMAAVFSWICDLARDGVWADTDYSGKSLKSMMKRADKDGAKYVLIAGESEFEKETAILKNMATGEQEEVSFSGLVTRVIKIIRNL